MTNFQLIASGVRPAHTRKHSSPSLRLKKIRGHVEWCSESPTWNTRGRAGRWTGGRTAGGRSRGSTSASAPGGDGGVGWGVGGGLGRGVQLTTCNEPGSQDRNGTSSYIIGALGGETRSGDLNKHLWSPGPKRLKSPGIETPPFRPPKGWQFSVWCFDIDNHEDNHSTGSGESTKRLTGKMRTRIGGMNIVPRFPSEIIKIMVEHRCGISNNQIQNIPLTSISLSLFAFVFKPHKPHKRKRKCRRGGHKRATREHSCYQLVCLTYKDGNSGTRQRCK